MTKPSTSPTPTATTSPNVPLWIGVRFWLTLVGVAGLDQLTKFWAVATFREGVLHPHPEAITVLPGFLYFGRIHNTGAAWGMLQGQGWLLATVAFVVLVALVVFRKWLSLHEARSQLIFGIFAGGVIGNLIDRLAYGYVIDFIDVHLPSYRWPTFNIADSALTVSVVALLILSWTEGKKEAKDEDKVSRE